MNNNGIKRKHSTDDCADGVGNEFPNLMKSLGLSSLIVRNRDASEEKDVCLPEILFNPDHIIDIDLHSWESHAKARTVLRSIIGNKTDLIPVGFDMQWPSYGDNKKTALIQICVREKTLICLFLRVYNLVSLPDYLKSFLIHPTVILVGMCINRNLKKLKTDFNLSDSSKIDALDCCRMAKKLITGDRPERWSLQAMTAHVLKKKLVVNESVQRSWWDRTLLSDEQVSYASAKVYACLLLYEALMDEPADEMAGKSEKNDESTLIIEK